MDTGQAVLDGGRRGVLAGQVAQERSGPLAEAQRVGLRLGLAVAFQDAAIRVHQQSQLPFRKLRKEKSFQDIEHGRIEGERLFRLPGSPMHRLLLKPR